MALLSHNSWANVRAPLIAAQKLFRAQNQAPDTTAFSAATSQGETLTIIHPYFFLPQTLPFQVPNPDRFANIFCAQGSATSITEQSRDSFSV